MRDSTWIVLLGFAGIAVLVIRAISGAKSSEKPVELPTSTIPPPAEKVIIDGEEVELEGVSDAELERIALEAGQETPNPEARDHGEDDDWIDLMANPASVTSRRAAQKVDLRSAARALTEAGIACRIGPSRASLVGIHTLQVKEPDLTRAMETLQSSGKEG